MSVRRRCDLCEAPACRERSGRHREDHRAAAPSIRSAGRGCRAPTSLPRHRGVACCFIRSTALRIGASGLRSSCASVIRNSSLRRSAWRKRIFCAPAFDQVRRLAREDVEQALRAFRRADAVPPSASRSCRAARQFASRAASTGPRACPAGEMLHDRRCPPGSRTSRTSETITRSPVAAPGRRCSSSRCSPTSSALSPARRIRGR